MQHLTRKGALERLDDFRIGVLREEDRQKYETSTMYSQTFPYFGGALFLSFLAYMLSKTDLSSADPSIIFGLVLGIGPSSFLLL